MELNNSSRIDIYGSDICRIKTLHTFNYDAFITIQQLYKSFEENKYVWI